MVQIAGFKKTTLSLLDAPVNVFERRPYLGMSEIGHSCTRFLWYRFRWAFTDEPSTRVRRLFNRGHREEPAIISELEKINYKVSELQKQFTYCYGHVQGHWDGKVENVVEAPKTAHVLEIKTMNDKAFKDVIKKGVKQSKPVYYAQAQLYMGHSKLKRCLFIAVNKNDDSYYIERIKADKTQLFLLNKRAMGVVLAELPPLRPFTSTWYECKWCSAYDICHKGAAPDVSCRMCIEAAPNNTGGWDCGSKELSINAQRCACDLYSPIDNT